MSSTRRVVTGAVVGLVGAIAGTASCGSTHEARATPSPDSAPEVAWKDKTREQRRAHMETVVLPAMKATFLSLDAEKFANFDCRTCHGAGADDASFRMPNPDLPQLPGASDGFERLLAEKPSVTAFMANVCVPAMASLLGEKPYGPDDRDGFGCLRCHVMKR